VLLSYGSTRIALKLGPLLIKVPRLSPRRCRINGAIANRLEALLARSVPTHGWTELCPVICALPFGIANVTRYARPLTDAEFDALAPPYRYPDPESSEGFQKDWGMLAGRPVVIDYAYWVHKEATNIGPPTLLHQYLPSARVVDDPDVSP
jgi:hypothetical protein